MKLTPSRKVLCAATISAAFAAQSQAAITNGGFETGDLSSWSSLGNISVSSGVDYGVGVVTPIAGTYAALLNTNNVSASVMAAQMGITEATLEASNSGTNATNGSLLWQTTTATAGEQFGFNWNFVEQDYVPYDDWAFYGISFNGGPATITKFASLATVGPGGGTTINGWESLNVDITASGSYTFYFGVVNGLDTALDSRLWIDGAVAQTGGTSGSANVPDSGSTLSLLGLAMAGFAGAQKLRHRFAR